MASQTKRILVVDDEKSTRNLLETSLSDQGYAVTAAGSGAEALWILLQEKPDLMVLDLAMPEMSGEHVCRIVKSDPTLSDIIIFILSGKDDQETKMNCFRIGAEEYLVKPIAMDELCMRITRFLAVSERTKSPVLERDGTVRIQLEDSIEKMNPNITPTIPMKNIHPETKNRYGTYRIERLVGKGGMGFVYKAFDEQLDRYVALKVLSKQWTNSAEFIERFRREARLIAAVNHPGIAQIYSLGEEEGESYFALLWCPGGSLRDLMREQRQIGLLPAIDIVLQCAKALSAASQKGVVHRDVKPSNIMFDENRQIKLVDFGIAHSEQMSSKLTVAQEILGSPAYMAPEQARGAKVDHRADIYSLGITFYQILYGELPFSADSPIQWVIRHATEPFPAFESLPNNIPLKVYKLILKMTQKNSIDRYHTYSELISELEQIQSELFRQCEWKIPSAKQISPEPAIQGESFSEVLSEILKLERSGILTTRWGPLQKQFYILRQDVVLFESPQQDENIWKRLMNKGILDSSQVPEQNHGLEENLNRLLFLQAFQLDDFTATYRELMKTAFLEVFRWPAVESEFHYAQITEDPFCRIPLRILFLEGVRNYLDFEIARQMVPHDRMIARTPEFDSILATLELPVAESFLASRIDGEQITIDTLQMLTGFAEEQIIRFLFTLKNLGAIEYKFVERRKRPRIPSLTETQEMIIPENAPKAPVSPKLSRPAESYYRLAGQAFNKKDFRNTHRYCREAIGLNPDESKYHHLNALALARMSEFKSLAEDEFRTAISQDPANVEYRLEFAYYLKENSKIAMALRECEAAHSIAPQDPRVEELLQSLR